MLNSNLLGVGCILVKGYLALFRQILKISSLECGSALACELKYDVSILCNGLSYH